MDIKSELDSHQVVLLTIPNEKYNNAILRLAKKLSHKNVIYVTTNKTYDSLKESFTESKVNMNKIVFIDTISKTLKKVDEKTDNCYYASSPGALTEISLVISKFLKHGFDYLIFDSLTNLAVYQKKSLVAKFVSSMINKVKTSNTKTVLYSVGSGREDIDKQVGMSVDNVVQFSSGTKVKSKKLVKCNKKVSKKTKVIKKKK